MDRADEVIKLFGLIPSENNVGIIRKLLTEELNKENLREHELLKTLCIQLFAIGCTEDVLLIWKAKIKDYDSMCYIESQLLYASGIKGVKAYLQGQESKDAKEAFEYIEKMEAMGEFEDFSREGQLEFYRGYYGV